MIDQVIESFIQAKNRKQKWDTLLSECFRYFLPQVEYYDSQNMAKSTSLYDSTGVLCLQSFAANLKYSLLPSWQRWCEVVAAPNFANQDISSVELNQKIEKSVTDPLFNALNHSNFDVEVSQSLLELGIGTGALLINEGDLHNPLIFSAVSIRDLVLEEGPLGSIENVYREHKIYPTDINTTWPKAQLTKDILDSKSKLNLLEATLYNNSTDSYDYLIIDQDRRQFIFKDNFKVSPWIIFRWSKVSGEIYGRGPAMQCLPDIKEANKIKELSLQNAVLSVVPTYMVAGDGVINPHTLKIRPGGVIPVRNLNSGSPIVPLPRGGDLRTAQYMLEQAREVVRKTLFTDRLGGFNDKVRSATEIMLRNQQLSKDIGAAFGRLQTELLQKMVNRCLYILIKKGLVMPIKIDAQEASLKITSPLSKIQHQEDLNSFMQLLPFYERFPDEFRLSLKTEMIPEFIAKLTGVSPSLIRNDEEKLNIAKDYRKTAEMGLKGNAKPDVNNQSEDDLHDGKVNYDDPYRGEGYSF